MQALLNCRGKMELQKNTHFLQVFSSALVHGLKMISCLWILPMRSLPLTVAWIPSQSEAAAAAGQPCGSAFQWPLWGVHHPFLVLNPFPTLGFSLSSSPEASKPG